MNVPVCTPPRSRARRVGRAKRTTEVRQLVGSELAGRPPWRDPRLPQGLVGQQVPDAGDDGLVQQPRLHCRVTTAQPLRELLRGDLLGVRTEPLAVRVEADPGEPPRVEQPQLAAVLERDREPVPGGVLGVPGGGAPARVGQPVAALGQLTVRFRHDDVAAHAEVDGQLRTRGMRPAESRGVAPDRLALTVRGRERPADQRLPDLPRRVRPADVGVGVVDVGDPAVQRGPFEGRPSTLDLGKLGHPASLSTHTGSCLSRVSVEGQRTPPMRRFSQGVISPRMIPMTMAIPPRIPKYGTWLSTE